MGFVAQAVAFQDSGTTLTISKPTGTTEGMVMRAFLIHSAGTSGGLTPPSGWTAIDGGTVGTSEASAGAWYKVAGSSEPSSYDFGCDSNDVHGIITTFDGIDTVSPISDATLTAHLSANTVFSPSVTPTDANCILDCVFGADQASPQSVTWSSLGERYDATETSTSMLLAAADGAATVATTYTETITKTGGNSRPCSLYVAWKPAAVASRRVFVTHT